MLLLDVVIDIENKILNNNKIISINFIHNGKFIKYDFPDEKDIINSALELIYTEKNLWL